MEIVLGILGSLIVLIVVVRLLNRLTRPIVRSATTTASMLRFLRAMSKRLPEGTLFNIADQKIRETGDAMLLDGATTEEINIAMLDMLEEKYSDIPRLLFEYPSQTIQIVGYQ